MEKRSKTDIPLPEIQLAIHVQNPSIILAGRAKDVRGEVNLESTKSQHLKKVRISWTILLPMSL